jgi:Outer membrane protein beta-barrel domain
MGKKILAFAFLLFMAAAGTVSAQTFHLGLEGGANFANALGPDIGSDTSSVLGFVGGGFLELKFGNSFSIQPEVLYEQKGAQNTDGSQVIHLDYVEVPILFKLSLGTPGINPAVFVGPAFDFNVLAQFAQDGNTSDITGANSSDIGLVGGVEVALDRFFISGRYELGLDNVTQNQNIQTGVVTLLAGYSFM